MNEIINTAVEAGGPVLIALLMFLLHRGSLKAFRVDMASARKAFREERSLDRQEFRNQLAVERADCATRHEEVMEGLKQNRHDVKDLAQVVTMNTAVMREVLLRRKDIPPVEDGA
jgi:hypothetical protein